MRKLGTKFMDKIFFQAISDLCINLSAGWFGAAFIVPNAVGKRGKVKFWILTVDIFLGIIFLVLSVQLRKRL